jgi:hypothetical protein
VDDEPLIGALTHSLRTPILELPIQNVESPRAD